MPKKPFVRPEVEKPKSGEAGSASRLTNVRQNRNSTSGEGPKTVRLTAAEKHICTTLCDSIREITPKTISESKVLRAALYLAEEAGPEAVLRVIKDKL